MKGGTVAEIGEPKDESQDNNKVSKIALNFVNTLFCYPFTKHVELKIALRC